MLNCTDLECILHHHHYYAHLHQLQPHLGRDALSTAAEDVEEDIQSPENDTNSLQSLSHLEPPLDNTFVICGVLFAMALVGFIIILLAVTISKLRKREDAAAHNSVHPEQVQVSSVGAGLTNPALSDSSPSLVESCCPAAAPAPGGCVGNNPHDGPAANIFAAAAATQADHFIWQFPPPYPPPNTPPPQYTLYNDQDTLVHGHGQGFAKGFRKNLGGRWRRLVKRKPESETCAIPPELKDQLKTIYVY